MNNNNNNNNNSNNDDNEYQKAQSELSSLNRVYHKLALTEAGEPLQKVLSLLLPRLLTRIGTNHKLTLSTKTNVSLKQLYNQIHLKLIDMMSHIMKRAREDRNLNLPCISILGLLYNESKRTAYTALDPFALNLSLSFLTLGISRCNDSSTSSELIQLLFGFLVLLGEHTQTNTIAKKTQCFQIGHLVLRCIELLVVSTTTTPTNNNTKQQHQKVEEEMKHIRSLCDINQNIGNALFNLLLDGLLYQNNNHSTTPSFGLSKHGYDRLQSGASYTSSSSAWKQEYASSTKLKEFKLNLLHFLTPTKKSWCIFSSSSSDPDENNDIGIARTVALLVIGSGDGHLDVSNRAMEYLKIYFDNINSTSSDSSSSSTKKEKSSSSSGNPIQLTIYLLSLVIGDVASNKIIQEYSFKSSSLSLNYANDDKDWMRRMVSDKTITILFNFITIRILEEMPQLFYFENESRNGSSSIAYIIGNLLLAASHYCMNSSSSRIVVSLNSSSSSNSATGGINPRIAYVQVLNSFSIQLTKLYDAAVLVPPSSQNNIRKDVSSVSNLKHILGKIIEISLSSLFSITSLSSSSSTNNNEANVRDASYGILCTLCRSQFVLCPEGILFHGCSSGTTNTKEEEDAILKVSSLSTTTAAQLFSCISNEVDSLRPRAIAALDALLGAYLKVYDTITTTNISSYSDDSNVNDATIDITQTSFNPWANNNKTTSTTTTIIAATTTNIAISKVASEEEWKNVSHTLIPLLWNAANNTRNNNKACRFASVQWSKLLLKKISLKQSCHLLCFLSGDLDLSICNLAKEGLDIPTSSSTTSDTIVEEENSISSPDLRQIFSILFQTQANTNTTISTQRPTYKDFSPIGKGITLRFILQNLFNDLYTTNDDNDTLTLFMNILKESLQEEFVSTKNKDSRENLDFLEECSYCLSTCLSSSHELRKSIIINDTSDTSFFGYKSMITLCISSGSSKARRYFANCCSYIFEDDTLWGSGTTSDDNNSCIDYDLLHPMKICLQKLEGISQGYQRNTSGEIHGAAFLGATCIRAIRLLPKETFHKLIQSSNDVQYYDLSSSITSCLGKGLLNTDESIANACSDSIHIAFSSSPNIDGGSSNSYYNDIPLLDSRLFESTALTIQNITIGLQKYSNGEDTDTFRVSKLVKAAGSILAASTSGSGVSTTTTNSIGAARLNCVDTLFSLLGSTASRKDPIIDLTIGEALVCYADTPLGVIWSAPTTASNTTQDEYDPDYARSLPPHIQVIYTFIKKESNATSPLKRNSCCPALLAIVGYAAKLVNTNGNLKHRMFIMEVVRHLVDIQNIFVTMLTDTKIKQFSRESCCLGLAACRGVACVADSTLENKDDIDVVVVNKDILNDRLLKAFGQTTNFGTSALQENEVERRARMNDNPGAGGATATTTAPLTEDFGSGTSTEVGGVAGLGESALSAFREMASAALSLNRPDILYLLMTLSVSDPIWSSPATQNRYNASSLLGYSGGKSGSIVKEVREVIRPQVSRLLPRFLRACYDPSKQTQIQMGAIWAAVAGDGAESRALISQNFTNIFDTLLDDTTNKLWRARLGASGALANIIIGRSWNELGGGDAVTNDDDLSEVAKTSKFSAAIRLLRLWKVTTRGLDDVRSNVREGAENLSRAITSLTIRLCDPSTADDSDENDANRYKVSKMDVEVSSSAAASSALWWLMKYGLNQPCPEAIGGCISCLLGIVEVSKPSTLQPVLPNLIGSLAMAISGLEPSVLSYLQARASGENLQSSDRIERVRLQIAQSGPISSALVKCLDMVRFTPAETQRSIIPELDTALRSGAGFATRVAAADGVNLLCNTCPAAFKFPGSSNTNPTVRLLRALHFASERERGSAAQDRMTHALGSIASLAPGSTVRLLALKVCKKFISSTGSNDDPKARKVAVSVLRSITVRATEQYSEGGPNNIWCKHVLPLAYLGIRDEDESVASQWREIWDEGGSVAVTTRKRKDFGCSATTSLEEALLPHIICISIKALNDVVWSRRLSGCNALVNLVDMNILAPLSNGIKQDSDNDFSLLRKKQRTQGSRTALTSCVRLMIRSRIWTGKAELVNTIVKLASKWLILDDKKSNFNLETYGWDSSSDNLQCPWVPVSMDFENESDLFIDDNYFYDERTYDYEVDEVEGMVDKANIKVEEEQDQVDHTEALLEGDELVLTEESLDEIEKTDESSVKESSKVISLVGLSKLLLSHAFIKSSSLDSELLPYRATCLKGLTEILYGIDKNTSTYFQEHAASEFKRNIYRLIKPKFLCEIQNETQSQQPPLVFARTIDCLAASMWNDIGADEEEENVFQLAEFLKHVCGPTQPVWKVREASLLACSTLVTKAHSLSLRKYGTIKIFIECTVQSSKDRKFWQVRVAGLKLLNKLVNRADRLSDSNQLCQDVTINLERQSMLEALLPYKEKILQLAKLSLADNEAKVSAIAGTICSTISWWP